MMHSHQLKVKDVGIDAYREHIIFLRADSHVIKSEGLAALNRVVVNFRDVHIIAAINVVHSKLLDAGYAGFSKAALEKLGVKEGDTITISHLKPLESLSKVRARMYGKELSRSDFKAIIHDIVEGYYSHVEIAAFVTACAGNNLSIQEIISLTQAMIEEGQCIKWGRPMILDKHCVGGLPGNRTTPIVVSIVAAAGLTIPKTSSKSITSPAGTADTMGAITKVDLSVEQIKEVIKKENGCLAWGGEIKLSPADDLLISVEKALDVYSEGLMVASMLSKKAAAGSTHVVIDIPVGSTAKVRTQEEALRLQYYFQAVGEAVGIHTEVLITDGSQPIGRGIGPALEAEDIIAVLNNSREAPDDLRQRALLIAAAVLKISGKFASGTERAIATSFLENGDAWKKFKAICEAQGGFKVPAVASFHYSFCAAADGRVKSVDNRKLARLAKLAGAPESVGAGLKYLAPLGKLVKAGEPLFTIYAASQGELDYARDYLNSYGNKQTIIELE